MAGLFCKVLASPRLFPRLSDSNRWRVEFESAEAILTDRFVGGGIEEIDEHELFRMTGEIVRIGVDKPFLGFEIGSIKAIAEVQTVRTVLCVDSDPVFGT